MLLPALESMAPLGRAVSVDPGAITLPSRRRPALGRRSPAKALLVTCVLLETIGVLLQWVMGARLRSSHQAIGSFFVAFPRIVAHARATDIGPEEESVPQPDDKDVLPAAAARAWRHVVAVSCLRSAVQHIARRITG